MKCFAFLFLVNVVPYAPITHVPISKAYILSKCIKIVEILKLVLKNCSASGYFYLFLFFYYSTAFRRVYLSPNCNVF